MLNRIPILIIILTLSAQYTFAQFYNNFFFPGPSKGALSSMDYKDNKINLFIKTNQQCDYYYDCHGLFSEEQQFETTGPFLNIYNHSFYSYISLIPEIRKSDAVTSIHKFPVYNDSVLFPYSCYTTYDSVIHCQFADALPNIVSSYYDENNNVHLLGYLEAGDCSSNLRYTSTLRYIKASSVLTPNLYSPIPDSTYLPDSLLQYYDIEKHPFTFSSNEYYNLGTLILPTADKQQLIFYTSAKEDSIRHFGVPAGINIIKLDSNLNRTYSQSLFSEYFDNDTSFLEILDTKHTTYHHNIYIEAHAYRILNSNFIGDTGYYLLITCDSNAIVLNTQIYRGYENHDITDHIDSINRLKETTYYNISNADSSCTVKYYNTAGIEIKSITFPQKLNHNLVKTQDNRYLFTGVSLDQFGYNQLNLNIYDSTGRLLKTAPFLLSISYFDNLSFGYNPIEFMALDTFKNVILFFQQPNNVGGSGCSAAFQSICAAIQNLDFTNYVEGNIQYDINNNCLSDSGETNAGNVMVELLLNNKHYYSYTDYFGNFKLAPRDTGHGKVILHLENQQYYANACRDTFDVVISDTLANPQVNFFVHTPACSHPTPKLNVDISTPFLRRCFDNLYTLTLFNESNDTAYNAYADLELVALLIATDTAFLSAQNLGNNTYRFELGDVAPLQTIRKQLKIKVDCDSTILGQTHCVKASASPYISCISADHTYFSATAGCRNDSVVFTIQSIGMPVDVYHHYTVIVNDTLSYQGQLHFTTTNAIQTLSYYNPEGKTFRLETVQTPVYPNEDTILSVSIEGCGNTDFSTGYITMFPQDDDQPNVSIDCHQNRGSYDPNDKSAKPVGYNDAHLIENTQAIEYTIHFQNLGTYAASFVVVTDTLSPAMDVATLRVLGASSDYFVSIIDSNILQFNLLNMELPAAADDSLLSNGFIKFSIKPKKNTAIGTAIHNNAYIYFDYNNPVKTNTVEHEIGKNFLGVNLISSVKNNLHNDLHTKVYPNPFNQTATLTFDYHQATQLIILSPDGRIVQQLSTTNNFYIINRNKLSSGTYFYELRNSITDELLDTGKLVIQ